MNEPSMRSSNLRKAANNVKRGPFDFRSEAVAAAKTDPDCLKVGAFTLLKNNGRYDYVVGANNILFSDDKPQATYQRLTFSGHWRTEKAK